MASAASSPAQSSKTLLQYYAKRDFTRTSEPRGGSTPEAGHRFVVQQHWARRPHFDFRLELDGVLKSWAVTRGPSANPKDKRLAVETEDHPVDYADFEGSIPVGEYGGGTVMLWDVGIWQSHDPDPASAYDKGLMKFALAGQRMKGDWTLVRMKPRAGKQENHSNWLLIKERDKFVESDDSLSTRHVTSVRSQRSKAEIEAGKAHLAVMKIPNFVAPALCRLQTEPPDGDDWLHEIKYDGYRMQLAIAGGKAIVRSREGYDWTAKLPAIAEAASGLNVQSAIIDGEAIVFDKRGVSNFAALVSSLENGSQAPTYVAFDLLMLNGCDLRPQTLEQRKQKLQRLLSGQQAGLLRYADHIAGHGAQVLEQAVAGGAEGIVSKRAESRYSSGRGHDWIKVKTVGRDDFSIVGYVPSQRGREFSALMLAQEEGDTLRYVGRVGTGFSAQVQTNILQQLQLRPGNAVPKEVADAGRAPKNARWVQPGFRAEIGFAGWTGDRQLRHARFLGLRESKKLSPKLPATKLPQPALNRLTHPDRMLIADGGLTKLRLAEYLVGIAPRMLPHLASRPVSFLRAPDGIDHPTFFQRHALPDMTAGIVPVSGGKPGKVYVALEGIEGLITAAQFSVIELHGWAARTPDLDHPDRIIFDLDPDESVLFTAVKAAAVEIRGVLEAAGLKSWPLLSGGKGIHVIAPLDGRNNWDEVERFTQGLARILATLSRERYVAVATKARRKGRIFIDYLRNKSSATAIVPYSIRARAGAPVALPVGWAALADVHAANAMHPSDALALKVDPWDGFFECAQAISTAALAGIENGLP